MAIREIAAISPIGITFDGQPAADPKGIVKFADLRAFATNLATTLAPLVRSASLTADWVEHRQLAITASYAIVDETAIFADATAAPVVVTLPASATETINRDIHVKKTDSGANAVTITPRGTDTIDGAASIAITTAGQSFHLLADGLGTWRVLSTVSASSGGGGIVSPATVMPTSVNFTGPVLDVSVKYAREDHRHKLDSTIIATGANAWTGSHAWSPSSNAVPVTINKTGSLSSASIVNILDAGANTLVTVNNAGLVGVNCQPDALVTIQAGADLFPITSGLLAWYKADSIVAGDVTGGDGSHGGLGGTPYIVQWRDSSGNGNTLFGHGIGTSNETNNDNARPVLTLPGIIVPGFSVADSAVLPCVRLQGVFGAQVGYFQLGGGATFSLTGGDTGDTGWTIFAIARDYQSIAQAHYYFGCDYALDTAHVDYVYDQVGANSNKAQWASQESLTTKHYSQQYTRGSGSDGNNVEVVALRCAAAGGLLNSWSDGTLETSLGDTRITDMVVRYIGRFHSGLNNNLGHQGKGLFELAIFNRALSDGEVATVNTYLLARVAGTYVSVGAYGLTHWRLATGTVDSVVDNGLRFGLGTASPAAKLHVLSTTTPQLRIAYDGSSYYTTAVAATTGAVTFDTNGSVPSFTFADPVNVTGNIVATGTVFGTNLVGTTNTLPIWTDGPNGVFGGSWLSQSGSNLVFADSTGTRAIVAASVGTGALGTNSVPWAGIYTNQIRPGSGQTLAIISTMDSEGGPSTKMFFNYTSPHTVVFQNLAGVDLASAVPLRFFEKTNTFNIQFTASDTMGVNLAYTWPDHDAAGVLKSDGAGTLSWNTTTIAVGANPTALVGNSAVNGSAATFMRSDGAPALDLTLARNWSAGVHTFAAQDVHNAGVSLGTSGVVNSAVTDAAAHILFQFKSAQTLTVSANPIDRSFMAFLDASGNELLSIAADGSVGIQTGLAHTGSALFECGLSSVVLPSANMTYGIRFVPKWGATAGSTIGGLVTAVSAAAFSANDNASATATSLIGGYFANGAIAARAHSNLAGAVFKAFENTLPTGTQAHGNIYGIFVRTPPGASGTGNTASNAYGIYIENAVAAKPTGMTDQCGIKIDEQTSTGATNKYGIFLATATAGYKAIAIRDTNTVIRSSAAATLTFDATTVENNADFKLMNAGNGLYVKEGSNATSGMATLVLGTVTVSTTKVTANSRIHLTVQALGTVAVATAIAITARSAGTSFTITSASATDTSTVAWLIVEPA